MWTAEMLFQRGILCYWIWVFHPIRSNISLSADKYKVEEGGNYVKNMSGVIETVADLERRPVYNHSGQHPFSPSLATKLFCPVHVGKKPIPYLQMVLSFKTQTSVFSIVHPRSPPCLKLLNPVSKCTLGRVRRESLPPWKNPDLKNSQGDN